VFVIGDVTLLFITPWPLWLISSTFYARFFHTKVLLYFHQSQNITREKLSKALWYKQHARKLLMKLTPEAVFLVMLGTSSFPAGHKVYGKNN